MWWVFKNIKLWKMIVKCSKIIIFSSSMIYLRMNLFHCNLYLFWKNNIVTHFLIKSIFVKDFWWMIFLHTYSTTLTLSIKIKPLFYISFETACKILSCLILIPNDNVLCYFLSFLASVLSIDRRLSKLTPKGYLGIYISISCHNLFLRLVKIS